MKAVYTFLTNLWVKFYLKKNPIIKLPKPTKLENIQSIVIFSNTALGDTLMRTPAIVATREAFPNAKIALFIAKNIYPLFKDYEFVDDFILYDKGYKGFLKNIFQIRTLKPDLILMYHSNGPQDIPTAILSGAKYILKTPRNGKHESLLSTKLSRDMAAHFIPLSLKTLEYITLKENSNITMKLPSKYHDFIAKKALGEGLRIGFQMRTSKPQREWGVENFAKLTQEILGHFTNAEIFLSGTNQEKIYCEKIYSLLPSNLHNKVHNVCGKYKIDELPFFLKSLDCLITGDTGPMHLAGALKIPSIALFLGGANPKTSGILQDKEIHIEICQEKPITPTEVLKAMQQLIKN